MISKRSIQHVIEAARVEEVVGAVVSLKKRGANMWGLCPFHNEKTPSFSVSPSKGIFKCFGCGKAGDSLKFLMEHDHFSYPEAIRHLAKMYNIELEETGGGEQGTETTEADSLYIMNEFAQNLFASDLFESEEGKTLGLAYFRERGFSEATIRKWRLGYAMNSFDYLIRKATAAGHQAEMLKKAGLVKENDRGLMDFFRGRVMFAIHGLSGKPVAFAGRILGKDEKLPKYINSPETEVYHKSNTLFGIFFAKQSIRMHDECFLTEGYTDVISLAQHGIENVVASSGTSLTVDQVRLIRRYTPNITLLYDGDAAGIKAALRGMEIVLEQDMNVNVVTLPAPEDPDSYIRQHGAAALLEYIAQNKKNIVLFKAGQLSEGTGGDPVKMAAVIREIVETIALIPDPIKRSLFVRECARIMQVEENMLMTEANKIRKKKFRDKTGAGVEEARLISASESKAKHQPPPESSDDLAERDVVRVMMQFGHLIYDDESQQTTGQFLLSQIEENEIVFSNAKFQQFIQSYDAALQLNEIPDQNFFLQNENEQLRALAIEILSSPYEFSQNWLDKHKIRVETPELRYRHDADNSLHRLLLKKIMKRIRENQDEMKNSEEEAEQDKYIETHGQLMRIKNEISKRLGTVVNK